MTIGLMMMTMTIMMMMMILEDDDDDDDLDRELFSRRPWLSSHFYPPFGGQ